MPQTASEMLGEVFGEPISIEILDASESGRRSIRRAPDGRVVAYNIVEFCREFRHYPSAHAEVLAGAPIADVFIKRRHKVKRVELCRFSFNPPRALADMFDVRGEQYPVEMVRVHVDELPYAEITEIYHPGVDLGGEYEARPGMIAEARRTLALTAFA